MTKRIGLALLALWVCCAPARAQFDAQATYASASGGSGTAVTVLIPNVTQLSDLTAVPLRVLMSQTITGASTLQVNSLAPVTINKKTPSGLAATINGDVVVGQIGIFTYDGSVFELEGPQLNLATIPSTNGFVEPINLQLNCTAAANALTCAVKAANTGGDPSALNPVYVPFADTTTTSGDPVWVTITAPVSFVFAGGNTAGCASSAPCRLWITLINNGGTVVLGLSNQTTAVAGTSAQCFPLEEGILQTTGSGTSGGNSAGTIYTSVSALSSKAVRIAGYVEWTSLTTAGNWTSPNFVRLFGAGVRRPCEHFGAVYANATSGATGVSQSITPSSAANLVFYAVTMNVSLASGQQNLQLKRGSQGLGQQQTGTSATGTSINSASFIGLDNPATTSSTSYSINFSVGTTNFISFYLEQVMGALEPANDNGPEQRMAG
jgi:hypothetical protein